MIKPGTKLGRYEIRSQLGVGGMGEVYLAEDTQLGRRVAIKLLPPETISDEHARKRLVREARAAATLDHPNICSVYEVGEAAGRSFIAMQYIEGETLDLKLKRKPLELKESLAIASQIADALAEAHTHGIIHRDIKPSNIMITSRGQAKVMDFGLAKLIQHSELAQSEAETEALLSTPGAILGTVPYMSPEQVRGEALDARSDLFSFGVVLYEMITSLAPFASGSAAETIAAIQTKEPLPLARYASEVPDELQRIVMKALAKDRDLRYQTMRDLAIDLQNVRRELEFESASRSRRDKPSNARVNNAVATTPGLLRTVLSLRSIIAAALLLTIGLLIGYFIYSHRTSLPPSPQIKSLAVLPLRSLNREINDDYLGLGIADTIITRTSQIRELEVRPMNAVAHYNDQQVDPREIARQLQVDSVLEGTVQRSGDLVRVSVSLLRAADGKQLWANNFTRPMNELFALQDEVSLSLVRTLKLHLTATQEQSLRTPPTRNAEAYDFYLRGEFHLSKPGKADITAALEMFERATALDPSFALAHIGVANACVGIIFSFEPNNKQLEERAYVAIEKALALDPNLAEAYQARGSLLWTRVNGFPHERAAFEYKHALAINPNLGTAHASLGSLYFHIGLLDKALVELETTLKLDPGGSFVPPRIARIHWYQQKYNQALSEFQSIQNLDDEKALTFWHLGRKDEARKLLEDSLKNPQRVEARGSDLAAAYAVILADAGENAKAEEQIRIAIRDGHEASHFHHAQFSIACAYALMGKTDLAVDWLKKCADNGMPCYPLFESEPALTNLHSDAKYIALMANLKKQWEAYMTTL